MQTIGWIGAGIMGKSMIRNLMKHGFEVLVYARTPQKACDIVEQGAKLAPTIAQCAAQSDVLITMVGFPKDVQEVYFGENGILAHMHKGSYVIDMTTSSPELAKDIYEQAQKRGIHALDAPVTGGDVGAKNGTLAILVGGEERDFEACKPIFQAMGENIQYQGSAGSGQHVKLANQIMIAGTLAGICEAICYGKRQGLDLMKMLDSLSTGAAGSRQLELLGPKILKKDNAPGFFIKHFIKDMKLAVKEAEQSGITLPVLQRVLQSYQQLEQRGYGELGTQALMKCYED